jgi:hypothetical protein
MTKDNVVSLDGVCLMVVDELQQTKGKFVRRTRDVVRRDYHVFRIMHGGPTYFDIVAFFSSDYGLRHEATNQLNALETFIDV